MASHPDEADLREQRRKIYRACEEVRRQIARELHDGVGQDLTGLLLGLSALEDMLVDELAQETCRDLVELARGIGIKLQRLAWEQQPTALQDFGLLRAVDSLVGHWVERNGVTLDLQEYGLGGVRLDPDIEIAAYRLIQAMLADLASNGEVRVASLVLERRGGALQIILEHDGRQPDEAEEHPAQRDERLAFVAGTLSVECGGLGTTIYLRIPLSEEVG